jgi:hypothetical protein
MVAKEWARLAERCNISIELVHHTRKTNGEDATTESGRGATALLAAARSGRVLNKLTDAQKAEAGLIGDCDTYFSVHRDKANLAQTDGSTYRHMIGVTLANGDSVGVAVEWEWPGAFDGVTVEDLLAVQRAIEGKSLRYSDRSGDKWAGLVVADVLGLDADQDRKRIKKMIETWLGSKALVKVMVKDESRHERPFVEVGEWASIV